MIIFKSNIGCVSNVPILIPHTPLSLQVWSRAWSSLYTVSREKLIKERGRKSGIYVTLLEYIA